MNHLQNKGFTLVELMVVIVIMGVLAAVGVPKLTSAVAKSKASEVAPAATTYIKLQSAYVMERKQIGVWKRIGYSKPKSDNFGYDRGDIKSRTKIEDLGEAGLVGWIATNKVSMRDCNQGNTWKVILQQGGTDSDGSVKLNFETEVSDAACAALAGDWTKVSKETQVAATTPEKTYKYSQGLFLESIENEDGKYSLSKAIVSGRQSSNMSGWTAYEQGANMTSAYGIEGYVFNKGKSGFSDADKASLSALLGGKEYQYEHILTELYDVSGDVSKVSAGIYKAKQSLYYGNQPSGTPYTNLLLYGVRDVYVKVDGSGAAKEFCADENCSQVIGVADNWDTSDVQQISDPFEQISADMIAASPLSSKTLSKSEMPDLVTKLNTNDATKISTIDGVAGLVISQDIADASKTDFNSMNPSPTGNDWAAIRVASQIYAEKLEPGFVYAATLSLYYGDKTTYEWADQRKVYAVTNGKYFYYFSDKECLNKITVNNHTFWQSDIGKME